MSGKELRTERFATGFKTYDNSKLLSNVSLECKNYDNYDVSYPLCDANITTSDALQICKDYGFDFGGVYEHHSHFNCWLCPLQRKGELRWIFENDKEKWDRLRDMQHQTDGTYYPNETIFDVI